MGQVRGFAINGIVVAGALLALAWGCQRTASVSGDGNAAKSIISNQAVAREVPATAPVATSAVTRAATTRATAGRVATTRRVLTTQQQAEVKAAAADRAIRRPVMTEQEYTELAAKLREQYSKPASEWPRATVDAGVKFAELGKLPPVPVPSDNPVTKQKQELGQTLFFDPRLSGSGQIACASCHDPDLAWADGRTTSYGHGRAALKRNAPSIQFAAYNSAMFWDGRATTLEEQMSMPVTAHDEMNGDPKAIVARLNKCPDYRQSFKDVFGVDEITFVEVSKAVATFERYIASLGGRSKFDRFLAGQTTQLSDEAVRGLHLFRTDARCLNCHGGPAMTDNDYHDLGLSYFGRQYEDLGRYRITKLAQDVGRFKTPSLRNVGRTRPYMHNGFFELDGLLAAYNAGMATLMPIGEQANDPLFPKKDKLLQHLHLNKHDLADVKAFLESLDEPPLRFRAPKMPEES